MKKKTFLLIIFIILIAGLTVYLIYKEAKFSKEILRLEILGPNLVNMGEEIEYTIKYKNNGNFALEGPKFVFDLPENSLTEDGKGRISRDLKEIYPGAEESIKIKARLLGKENDFKTAKASISYTPKNLTVRYESTTTFTVKINSVPITLDFDLPSKVEKGKDLQYSINYFSNVDYPMEDLSLKLDPVTGFEFVSSNPASLDNSEWKLPTLNKAQGGRITIKGKISAETDQSLNFAATLGVWKGGNFIPIKQTSVSSQVIQPLLFISQQVNGSPSYIASPGEVLHYQIFFRNIGSTPFDNLFAVVKIDGNALDMLSIQAPAGQIQDDMIIWSWQQEPALKHLDVQQEEVLDFTVKVKDNWSSSGDINNLLINNEVNISQIAKKFSIKVNSGLVISQAVYRKNSDIENYGPVPPITGKTTSYTVTWAIKNYFSDAKNVKVKAVLPQNVALTGKILPSDESANFSFDSASREIVWSVGDLAAGTGVSGDPVEISFQISLIPKNNQKGSTAQLIGSANISGENQFTNTNISANSASVDTSLPQDFANSGGGIVQ